MFFRSLSFLSEIMRFLRNWKCKNKNKFKIIHCFLMFFLPNSLSLSHFIFVFFLQIFVFFLQNYFPYPISLYFRRRVSHSPSRRWVSEWHVAGSNSSSRRCSPTPSTPPGGPSINSSNSRTVSTQTSQWAASLAT